MKRIRPFPFDRVPRVARAQVEAGRALLRHLPLEAGSLWPRAREALGGEVHIFLVEAYAFPGRELRDRLGDNIVVRLGAPGGRLALLVVEPQLGLGLARRVLGLDPPELPARPLTRPEEGALGFLAWALAGDPYRVEAVLEPHADARILLGDAMGLGLEARVETPAGSGWARLLLPERTRLATPLPRRAAHLLARRGRLSEARVSLAMEVGRTRLDRPDLARLAAGDVVLFDRFGPRPPFGGPMVLRLGRGLFDAHLGGDGLTILSPYRLGGPAMDDTTDNNESPADDGGADALLRELPVDLVCELGHVTMSGRELLELRPGAIIPVGRPLAGPVDLTVGGRVFARGELVDVEGEIGVRISQMVD